MESLLVAIQDFYGEKALYTIAGLAGIYILKATGNLIYRQYYRKQGEPPLVSGSIPFLGVGIDYQKNPRKFLGKMKDLHGNCFTLFLAGRRMTFVMDPHSFPGVYRERMLLDMDPFLLDIMDNVFNVPQNDFHAHMHTINKQYPVFLFGEELEILSKSFLKYLNKIVGDVKPEGSGSSWTKGKLNDFLGRLFFAASIQSLFGACDTNTLYDTFLVFDSDFPKLISGVPFGVGKAREFQKIALKCLEESLTSSTNDSRSRLITSRIQMLKDMEISDINQFRIHFALMWGSQSNTIAATFWSFAYIISTPKSYKAVMEELKVKTEFVGDLEKTFPVLNACVSEAMRLASGVFSVRRASEEYQLSILADQVDYLMRKEDTVVLALPFLHYDDELYPEPNVFDHTRFLERKTYEKDGIPVKNAFLPFGGGISLCPGRKFARNEIIMFAATLLSKFEFELVNEAGQGQKDANNLLPSLDESRFGMGYIPPLYDIPFQYRPLQ
jgi:hypothetical protein